MRNIESKILTRAALAAERERLRQAGRKVVFTNGSFDGIIGRYVAAAKIG